MQALCLFSIRDLNKFGFNALDAWDVLDALDALEDLDAFYALDALDAFFRQTFMSFILGGCILRYVCYLGGRKRFFRQTFMTFILGGCVLRYVCYMFL